MLFSIHALDKPDVAAKRQAFHRDHVAHMNSAKDFGVTMVVGGPLIADDGMASIGNLFVIEAPDRATVEAFNAADPLHKNGVWEKIEIRRFDRKK